MKILFVNSCISLNSPSRTFQIADTFIKKLVKEKGGTVVLEDLVNHPYSPLTVEKLKQRDKAIKEDIINSPFFLPAKRFADAEEIVIAAPYWDLSFPSELKAYIENIMVTNVTFTYKNNMPVGLCNAKKLTYITTSGGYIGENDFGFEYIKSVANMLGIEKCVKISAEGLDIISADVNSIIRKAVEEINND